MSAVLLNVIVPDGDLILVMTSDEAWKKQQEAEEQMGSGASFQFIDLSSQGTKRHTVKRQPDQDLCSGDIRLQVDSKHLMRISKPFRVFLDSKSYEGLTLLQDGQLELILDEDDPEAMCHLMNCIFGRMKEVPGLLSDAEIDFDTFVEACVIVDKYDLYEPTYLLLEHWWKIHAPNKPDFSVIELVNDNFFKWLSVAHILGKKQLVHDLMGVYAREGKGLDEVEFLPYPSDLEKVEGRRVHAFGAINQFLERLRLSAGGMHSPPVCDCTDDTAARKCDKAMFDSIMKILTRQQRRTHRTYGNPHSNLVMPPGAVTIVDRATKVVRIESKKISFGALTRYLKQTRFSHVCKQEIERQAKESENNKRHLQLMNIDNLVNHEAEDPMIVESSNTWMLPNQDPGLQPMPCGTAFLNAFTFPSLTPASTTIPPFSWDTFVNPNIDLDAQISDWLGSCWPVDTIRPSDLSDQTRQSLQLQPSDRFSTWAAMDTLPALTGSAAPAAQKPTPCNSPKKTLNKVLDDIRTRMLNLSKPFEVINVD